MNISETFLNDAEEIRLYIDGQTAEVLDRR